MKRIILLSALALSGCGSLNQAVTAYGAVAVQNAQQTNDTVIQAWKLAACATPVSAAVRNPEIIPALKELCPGVKASGLLDK